MPGSASNPRWYIGGYTLIIEGILRSIVKQATSSRFSRVNGEKLADDITAVMKAAMIDMDNGISSIWRPWQSSGKL